MGSNHGGVYWGGNGENGVEILCYAACAAGAGGRGPELNCTPPPPSPGYELRLR